MEFITANLDIILWIVLAISFFVIELATVATVSIWFVCGSIVALALALLGLPVLLQIVAAIAVSGGMLIGLRKMLNKSHSNKALPQSITENLVLKTGTVSSAIEPGEIGQVMIDGIAWSARGVDEEERFAEKMRVVVRRHEGIILYVEKYEPLS